MPAQVAPERLRGVTLFDGLSLEDLERLLESFEDLSLVAGQLLFRPGDLEPALYVVRLSRTVYDELLREGSLPASRLGTKAADILAARLQATDRWISQLLGEEQQAITMSWRRFREGLGGSFDFPHGFIHPY